MSTVFEGVTIDPEGARDLDDAIWVSRDGHGWTVKVAFPRLTHKIPIDSRVDLDARARLASTYRGTDFMLPMLHPGVTDRASLTRGMRKDVFLVTIRIGRAFQVEDVACEISRFESLGQLSYRLASDLVRTGRGPIGEMLGQARDLAHGLFDRRRAAGGIAYYDFERGIALDEEGATILMTGEGHVAEMIVSEFMVLTNGGLAAFTAGRGIPLLYRNHDAPKSHERHEILARLKGVSDNADVDVRTLPMVLGRAKIGVAPRGHYALNVGAYAWFTSPLRRYADLVNQRMLEASLVGKDAPHDIEALDAFAEAINARADEEAPRKALRMKNRALRKAEERIERGNVARASEQDFRQVVKVLAENPDAMTPQAEAESLRRIKEGLVTSKETARFLMMGGRVASAAIERLVAYPHESAQVMIYGGTSLGWGTPRFVEQSGGPSHAPVFASQGFVEVDGREHASPQVVRATKKLAQQIATIHLLAAIAGLEMPESVDPEAMPSDESKPKIFEAEKNPRSMLQEVCQKRKWPLPVFVVTEQGPQTNRLFQAVVTVVVNGQPKKSRPAKDRTRKGAEKAAAEAMLKALASA